MVDVDIQALVQALNTAAPAALNVDDDGALELLKVLHRRSSTVCLSVIGHLCRAAASHPIIAHRQELPRELLHIPSRKRTSKPCLSYRVTAAGRRENYTCLDIALACTLHSPPHQAIREIRSDRGTVCRGFSLTPENRWWLKDTL
jgi:hypothetical protein